VRRKAAERRGSSSASPFLNNWLLKKGENTMRKRFVYTAMLLAWNCGFAHAQPPITVDEGGLCTLSDAITAANTDTASGGCSAGSGADTIILQTDVVLTAALPAITSPVTIEGGGYKIDGNQGNWSVLKIMSGGNLALNETTVTGGNTASYASGGGIYNEGTVTLTKSTLSGNVSDMNGGGIFNYFGSHATLNNSTVSGNSARNRAGGIYTAGVLTLNNSTVSGNLAGSNGGGIWNNNGTITLNNSTVSENSANGGGGVFNYGLLALNNSTVSGNKSTSGGGIYNANGTVALRSSIISGNLAGSAKEVYHGSGTVTADSFNLFGHSGETATVAFFGFTPGSGDVTATSDGTIPTALDAILHPLADNGGLTKTHALPEGSPAIDLDTTCSTDLTEDQRGYSRPFGTGCDTGSFELSAQATVTPSAGTGGSISPDSPQTVNQSATVSFTVLADSGYKIESVEGCGGTLSGNTYTTAPVTEDCEVTASFTPHISRNGMTWGVNNYNADLDITRVHCYGKIGPNRGPCNPYQGDTSCSAPLPVLCVKVDGTPRPPYALAKCSTCAMYDEYYNGWAEGSIGLTAPAQGNAFANLADADAYCAAQLGEGYKVAEHHTGRYVMGMDENNFYGDTWPANTSAGGWGLYGPGQLADTSRFWVDINDQDANCWGRDPSNRYTVTPSAGTGGSINPDTPQSVDYGKDTSFTVTPETGYSIDTVEGCGGTLVGSTYTTGAITADCTVTASFVINKYTVTPSAGSGGSISPNTPQSVDYGKDTSFTVTPDAGYLIETVEGCGGSLDGNIYTTGAITADCAVTATFVSSTTYTVTPRSGRHGSISPSVPQTVHKDRTVSFTVTPDAGWRIDRVRGCGGTLSGNIYTIAPASRDCTVKARFERIPRHTVTTEVNGRGSITPRRPQRVIEGNAVSFTVTPDAGYAIKRVRGCRGSLNGDVYTTGPVRRDCTVRASFGRK
jgi:hypothetical protein